MAATEVPDGTAAEVLAWVDEDPQRAQTALEAENCKDNPRSTLVAKLEAIAAKETAPVSDQTATTEPDAPETQDEETELAPGPEQPEEIEIYAEDAGTVIHPVAVRDPDVEVADDAVIAADPEYDRSPEAAQVRARSALEDADIEPISGDQTDFIAAASASNGLVLRVNGSSFALNAQQVAQLKQIVDRTVVGLAL